MDQLAWPLALIADCWLEAEPAELAHPDPQQDPRDGRERHLKRLRDLRASEPQTPQRRDRLHPLLARAMRDAPGSRGAIQQPELALCSIATNPLSSAADADFGGLGRLRQRPGSSTTRSQSSRRLFRLSAALACRFIRCPPWDWGAWQLPASKGARMNQPTQELQLIWREFCQVAAWGASLLRGFFVGREGGASGSVSALPV